MVRLLIEQKKVPPTCYVIPIPNSFYSSLSLWETAVLSLHWIFYGKLLCLHSCGFLGEEHLLFNLMDRKIVNIR